MQKQSHNPEKPSKSTKTPEKHTAQDYKKAKAKADAKNEKIEEKEALEKEMEEIVTDLIDVALQKSQKTPYGDEVLEIFASDELKILLKQKLDEGYEYAGFEEDGLVLNWYKGGEAIKELNPIFHQKNINKNLSEDLREKILELGKKESKELEEKLHTEFWYIVEELLEKGAIGPSFFSKDLSVRQINAVNKSDFKKEVTAVLIENIKAEKDGREAFYEIEVTKKGVRFIASKEFKEEGGEDVEFNVEDYDRKLNYPKEAKVFETKEPEIKKEEIAKTMTEEVKKSEEKWKKIIEIQKEMPEYQEMEDFLEEYTGLESLDETEVWEMVEKTTELMDSTAGKIEGFDLLNEDVGAMIPKMIEAVKTAKENGEDLKDVLDNIEGLEDLNNKLREKDKEVKESGDLEQEAALDLYGDLLETMFDLTAKYKPSETE